MNDKTGKKVIILLTIDCLRRDHLKTYGYHRDTAPNLENFIENGTIFLDAIANGPETPSSFSSIFSSLLPYLNGGFCPLPNQKNIFTEILHNNGIHNYGIHSNPNLGRYFNYHRGFDVFIDGLKFFLPPRAPKKKINERIRKWRLRDLIRYSIFQNILKSKFIKGIFSKFLHRLVGYNRFRSWFINIDIFRDALSQINPKKGFTAPYIIRKIINFLTKYNSSKSLFLWAHFMDVHNPYDPPPKNLLRFINKDISAQERDILNNRVYFYYKSKYKVTPKSVEKLIDLYDGAINFIDDQLPKFFKIIKKKFKKNCLVIITADHGDSFYEHKTLGHQGHLYDELVRVPLFIVEIGNNSKIKNVENTVQLMDIAPTILDYLNIKIPENYQGKSLLSLINGKNIDPDRKIVSESYQKGGIFQRNENEGYKIFSIRFKNWKYFYDEEAKKEYLFNLIEDPSEKKNLINELPEMVNEFKKFRDEHFTESIKSSEESKIEYSIRKIDFSKLIKI